VISLLVFFLMNLAPGDFLDTARAQRDISPEVIQKLEQDYGLDQPWTVQYWRWLQKAVSLDFGYSWTYKVDVTDLLVQRVPATLGLALASLLLAWVVALPLGVLAAIYKDSVFDRLSSALAYAAISLPEFFVALLALYLAAASGLFPVGGLSSITSDFLPVPLQVADYFWHLALPTLVLGLGGVAGTMRIMRSTFLDSIRAEYVTTARAKGLSEFSVMFKHALRNAINPFITSLGFAFSGLLSGSLMIENIFNYPGLGQLTYQAFLKQDQYLVLASVVLGATMLIFGNLLADLLLAASDPRIRLEQRLSYTPKRIFILFLTLLVSLLFCYLLSLLPWSSKAFWVSLKNTGLVFLVGAALFVLWTAWPVLRRILPQLLKKPLGIFSFSLLTILYSLALLASFLAPYSSSNQSLIHSYHPPTKILWKEHKLQVQLYQNTDPTIAQYQVIPGSTTPLRWFVQAEPYHFLGLFPCRTRLIGVDAPHRLYLFGADPTGRDVFSRLLEGSKISLSLGLIGVTITMVLGFIIGGLSGYLGGLFDMIAMRATEIIMSIPGLYLLIALRSALSPFFDSGEMFFLIVIVLSFIGWTGTARVIRGMTLSVRQRPYVLAAESMGQSRLNILLKHVLPNIASYLVISATLSIPAYILGEASLSFLGLGIQEPSASWGLMLAQAQEMKVLMLRFLWLFLPGLMIFLVVMAFNLLGDELRDIIDPKFRTDTRT
jgi:ABC-type dipeptide/oligopeptide/nickel transport system permease component